MKCLYCDEEMVYKPNMRGYIDNSLYGMSSNYNTLVVDYTEDVEEDYIIAKLKKERAKILEINPQYYVCPECGLVLQKIPKEDIDDVINAER